jgi:hypothetical protein
MSTTMVSFSEHASLVRIRANIELFHDRCEHQDYTDTGDVWTLLREIYTLAGGDEAELDVEMP